MFVIRQPLRLLSVQVANISLLKRAGSKLKPSTSLRENRAGRATFLPLTTIKARSISGQNQDVIASSPGFLGMADELVTFDAKLEAIFKNLLATTAIFDTVEHARDAARKVR